MQVRLFGLIGTLIVVATTSAAAQTIVQPGASTRTCEKTPVQVAAGAYLPERLSTPVTVLEPGRIPPKYPPALKAAGVEGSVTFQFVVDTTGKAEVCSLNVTTATNERFVAEAGNYLLTVKYTPGIRNGGPVRALVTQTIQFKLEK